MAFDLRSKLKGCYRRVLIFLLIFFTITAVAVMVIYRQIGGIEGARYWMAGRAIRSVEAQFFRQRPDGISEASAKDRFDQLYAANRRKETDLAKLYRVLKNYQNDFENTKPSNSEAIQFFNELDSVLIEDDEK